MKWQKNLIFMRCCYLKSHSFTMWAVNCWRQFYLELGFYFMVYILLSHIILNTLCGKCRRVSLYLFVYVYLCICVCVVEFFLLCLCYFGSTKIMLNLRISWLKMLIHVKLFSLSIYFFLFNRIKLPAFIYEYIYLSIYLYVCRCVYSISVFYLLKAGWPQKIQNNNNNNNIICCWQKKIKKKQMNIESTSWKYVSQQG